MDLGLDKLGYPGVFDAQIKALWAGAKIAKGYRLIFYLVDLGFKMHVPYWNMVFRWDTDIMKNSLVWMRGGMGSCVCLVEGGDIIFQQNTGPT